MTIHGALRLIPEYHERVWGGQRLKPSDPPTGEAWIVFEHNKVAAGPHAGRSIRDLASDYSAELLGRSAVERTGTRFPLLIKLLDTSDWLSLQVHPNDEQAEWLEGPGQFGKTEAWHIVEADPGAELIAGLRPGTTAEALGQAVKNGTILDLVQYVKVAPLDTLFVPAGTIHALGPGLLLYEVQQTSDITYRVFDWNRPQSAGRALHVDQTLAVAEPDMRSFPAAAHIAADEPQQLLVCPYFQLDLLGGPRPVEINTDGQSFHAVTITEGSARIEGAGWSEELRRFESVVIPAACGAYRVELISNGQTEARALVAHVPATTTPGR